MKEKKTIMVLPGTVWQIPLIKKIKEKGYRAAVVHPYENAPAFKYADEIVYADILNQEDCLKAAKRLNVCAVMSDECDIATPTLAYVSSKLGLPSQGEAMAKLYTNKYLMREACYAHNLPCPEYKLCKTVEEAVDFFKKLNAKMIMKPIDANSSRGVFSIYNENDIRNHFDESIGYSHHEKAVICERYITGAEFSVDGIKMPDGHVSLAISEKQQFSYNQNLDSNLIFSYYSDKYDYDLLRKINNEYVEKSNLPFGFTHAEYKYQDGQFYLLEIGARGGGNLISSHIVPALTGIDNYSILIDMFNGNDVRENINQEHLNKEKVAILHFFDTTEKGGTVKDVKGLDFLENNKNVLYYQMNFNIGDCIKRPTDGGNRVGFYVACCDNMNSLRDLISDVEQKFEIVYE